MLLVSFFDNVSGKVITENRNVLLPGKEDISRLTYDVRSYLLFSEADSPDKIDYSNSSIYNLANGKGVVDSERFPFNNNAAHQFLNDNNESENAIQYGGINNSVLKDRIGAIRKYLIVKHLIDEFIQQFYLDSINKEKIEQINEQIKKAAAIKIEDRQNAAEYEKQLAIQKNELLKQMILNHEQRLKEINALNFEITALIRQRDEIVQVAVKSISEQIKNNAIFDSIPPQEKDEKIQAVVADVINRKIELSKKEKKIDNDISDLENKLSDIKNEVRNRSPAAIFPKDPSQGTLSFNTARNVEKRVAKDPEYKKLEKELSDKKREKVDVQKEKEEMKNPQFMAKILEDNNINTSNIPQSEMQKLNDSITTAAQPTIDAAVDLEITIDMKSEKLEVDRQTANKTAQYEKETASAAGIPPNTTSFLDDFLSDEPDVSSGIALK